MRKIDETVIQKAKNGDNEAFNLIYEETHNLAYSIALSYVHNEEDADDIVQDSYFKLVKNWDNIKNDKKLVSYLGNIVSNTSKDFLKKKRPGLFSEMLKVDETFEDFEENYLVVDKENYVEHDLEKKEVSIRLRDAIMALPEEQSYVVMEHYYYGRTVDDIAQELGVSRNTVLSRLNYARKKLAKELKKDKDNKLFGIALFPLIQRTYNDSIDKCVPSSVSKRALKRITKEAAKSNLLKGSVTKNAFVAFSALTTTQKIVAVIVICTSIIGVAIGTNAVVDMIENNKESNVVEAGLINDDSFIDKENKVVINQGKGCVVYNDQLIGCNNNEVCFVENDKHIYSAKPNSFVLINDNLFFVYDGKLINYDLKADKVLKELSVNANEIYYGKNLIAINTTDGNVFVLDNNGTVTNSFKTYAESSKMIDGKLYYYKNNSLYYYDLSSITEPKLVFSGEDNYGMRFSYQVRDNVCYFPNFFSDENGKLYYNGGNGIDFITLNKPFIEFGVTDSYIYYSSYDNDFYRMHKTTKAEEKMYDNDLIFIGEYDNYTAWYDKDKDISLIISMDSEKFDYIIQNRIDNLIVKKGYLFYTVNSNYYCKPLSDLEEY